MATQKKKEPAPAGTPPAWTDKAQEFADIVGFMQDLFAQEPREEITLPTLTEPPPLTEKQKKRRKIGDRFAGAADIAGGLGQAVGAYQMSRAGRATPPHRPVGAVARRRITQRAEEQNRQQIEEKNAAIARQQAELNARMGMMKDPSQSLLGSIMPSVAAGIFGRQAQGGPSDPYGRQLQLLQQQPWFRNLPPEEQAVYVQRALDVEGPEGRPTTSRPASPIQQVEALKNEPGFQELPPERQYEIVQGILTRQDASDPMSDLIRLVGPLMRPDAFGRPADPGAAGAQATEAYDVLDQWARDRGLTPDVEPPPPGAPEPGAAAQLLGPLGVEAQPVAPAMRVSGADLWQRAQQMQEEDPEVLAWRIGGYKRAIEANPNQAAEMRQTFIRKHGVDPETGQPAR